MPCAETFIQAPPEDVFDLLADPWSYVDWVAGTHAIREVDPRWPRRGARFHHTLAFGPLHVSDYSVAETARRPRLLRFRGKARPVGTAHVTFDLRPRRGGTRVTLTEDPADPLTGLLFFPWAHLLVRRRMVISLRRLKRLVEAGEGARAHAA